MSAELVKTLAAGLVERHAARLGMDAFAASHLVDAIRAIKIEAPAEKAKTTLLGIEIPRDELACRIAETSMGVVRPKGTTPAEAFAQMEAIDPGQAQRWRQAADRCVLFFHECISAGRQPS